MAAPIESSFEFPHCLFGRQGGVATHACDAAERIGRTLLPLHVCGCCCGAAVDNVDVVDDNVNVVVVE